MVRIPPLHGGDRGFESHSGQIFLFIGDTCENLFMTKKYFYLEYKNKFTQDIIIKNVFDEIFIFCGDIKHEIIINNIKKDNITEDFLNLCIYYLFKYQMEDRANYKLDILKFLNKNNTIFLFSIN